MARRFDPLARARAICLALPEATEKTAWGAPTFRVRDKMFASYADHHHGVEWIALWVNAPPGVQEMLVDADADRFFVPPYVGKRGWVGVRLEADMDFDQLADVVEEGYRVVAPKRLLAELDGE